MPRIDTIELLLPIEAFGIERVAFIGELLCEHIKELACLEIAGCGGVVEDLCLCLLQHMEAAEARPWAQSEKSGVYVAKAIEPLHSRVDPAVHGDVHRARDVVIVWREDDRGSRLLCIGGEGEEQHGGHCREGRRTKTHGTPLMQGFVTLDLPLSFTNCRATGA